MAAFTILGCLNAYLGQKHNFIDFIFFLEKKMKVRNDTGENLKDNETDFIFILSVMPKFLLTL